MDDLVDLMIDNESPTDITDRIKELLYAKSADSVEGLRPSVAAGLFGDDSEFEQDVDLDASVTNDVEEEPEEDPNKLLAVLGRCPACLKPRTRRGRGAYL